MFQLGSDFLRRVCLRSRRAVAGRWGTFGGIGGVVDAFVGYYTRRSLVSDLRVQDILVAISEEVVAIALALLIVSR